MDFLPSTKWIWASSDGRRRRHELYGFAAEFTSAVQQDADIRVAASCGYELWIDGQYIQRGPLRCPPNTFAIDTWPIKIDKGEHHIVLLAQRDGEPSGLYVYQPGRLLIEIVGNDKNTVLVSDRYWRCRVIPEWERRAYASEFLAGFSEHWIEKEHPWVWPPDAEHTRNWGNAIEVGSPHEFGEKFESRNFPEMEETKTVLSKLLRATQVKHDTESVPNSQQWAGVQFRWRSCKGNWLAHCIPIPEDDSQPPPNYAAHAWQERHIPLPSHIRGLPAVLPTSIKFPFCLSGLNGEDVCLLWDFGGSFSGRYHLTFSCSSAGIVDILQGEVIKSDQSLANDSWCDRFEAEPGCRSWRLLAVRAGRYVQIILRGFHGDLKIDDFHVEETHYPWAYRPEFECCDAELTRIFKASLRTAELCFDDVGMDCPHRERIAYQFDGWAPARTIFFCTGDKRPWRRSMELQPANFDPNRSSGPLLAGNPADVEDSFPGFNLFYLHEVAHYYRCTGDKKLVRTLWPVLLGVLQWYRRFEWQGLLRDVPGRHFYEWTDRVPRPPLDRSYPEWRNACEHLKRATGGYSDWDSQHSRGFSTIINSLYLRALMAMLELASVVGNREFEEKLHELIRNTRVAFQRNLWVAKMGLFADGADDNGPVSELSEVANAYALWAGVLSRREAQALIGQLRDPNRLMIRIQSPYALQFYTYGLADYGEHSLAVSLIRWAYLHHLDNGGNTLGERFPFGSSSMIHGINGFVAVWLLECGLGLRREICKDNGRQSLWAFYPPENGYNLPKGYCKVYPGGQELEYHWE